MTIGHEKFHFRSGDDLQAKSQSMGLDIPFSQDIDALFEPVSLGGKILPNRLAVQPMEGADAAPGGAPGELTSRRYRRFAESGCGLIWFEAAAVRDDGRSNPHQLLLTRKTLDGFKRLVETTRDAARKNAGWNSSPVLVLQLTHAGRFSKPRGTPAPIIAQRNPYLDPLHKIPPDHPLIADRELDDLQEVFVQAAKTAVEAGFDGVDIKACHGYLVSELLASRSREDSRYGGSFEARTRFLRETAGKIKAAVPEVMLAGRLGLFDSIPYPYGFGVKGRAFAAEADPQTKPGAPTAAPAAVDEKDEANPDMSEPVALVKDLLHAGLELLNITAGIPAYRPHYGRPFDTPVAGGNVPGEHPLTSIARLIGLASRTRREFPALPVVGTGYTWLRGFFPHVAAGVIESGGASLIGVGRMAYAYPDFARDLMDKGALDPKKVCLTCSGCSALLRAGGPVGCVVRDRGIYKAVKT
jgi:2,4-dienoyl-CoA reductase-like NADH-dependent reductase (Old Yellow Enzyme family)